MSANILRVLIPIGLIGVFRWTCWVIRRLPACLYRSVTNDHREPMSVVTPVYQEDPEIFRLAVLSWLANPFVREILCVVDVTDVVCQDIVRSFADRHPVQLFVTDVPGKRPALRLGWEHATCDLVALVDSDTIWAEDVSERVCEPFVDAQVYGVATRQNVYNPAAFLQYITDIYLDYRYFDENASQTVMGQAISCLSGRTAVYRREFLMDVGDEFVNQRFAGRLCNSGDDKCLTTLLLQRGHRTYLQRSARVWSTFPADARSFFMQRLRWGRNTWRSDLTALRKGWVFSHPFLAFTMIDKAISSFTLLLGPVFLIWAVATQNWLLVVTLPIWWLVSRAVKLLPHLRRRPVDVWRLPGFIGLTWVMAVVKIYALATIGTQRWLTRKVAVVDGEVTRVA